MTISTNPDDLKKLKELAARNIANGDWGDEITFPGETVPVAPAERAAKNTSSHILSNLGDQPLPKRK